MKNSSTVIALGFV